MCAHIELVEALKKAETVIAASLLLMCGLSPTKRNVEQVIDDAETGTVLGDIHHLLKKAGETK